MQTLVLDKEKFPTARAARRWANNHDFISTKVDETENSFRLRQRDPGEFKEGSFRTITISDGIKAVIGRLKEAKSATDLAKHLPELADEVSKIAGDFVLDACLREDGSIAVTDSLYVPTAGNVTQKRYVERVIADSENDNMLTPWRRRWFRLTTTGIELADRCIKDPSLEES